MDVHSFKTLDINIQVSGKRLKKKLIVTDGYPSGYLHSILETCKQMATAVSYHLMLRLHSQQMQYNVQQCRMECFYP